MPQDVKHPVPDFRVTAAAGDAGERLDRVLARAVPALSRSRLQALIRGGHVSDDAGRPVTAPDFRVREGQTFAIFVPESEPPEPAGQSIPLDIVYEDEDVIVIDKPAGLVIHPAPGNPDRTLVNALIAHCGDSLSGIGGTRRPGIVHRLDKDTSGLLVAAKNDRAHRCLAAQFKARSIRRAYRAVVWGVPRPPSGRIEGSIGRDPRNRKRMAVVARGGKPAATRYRTLRVFDETASLLECRLETGRTHQIRVHLAARGHPVVGDPLYGGARRRRGVALPPFPRQALHAVSLGFRHPATEKWLTFESKLPHDIVALMETLEGLARSDGGIPGTADIGDGGTVK